MHLKIKINGYVPKFEYRYITAYLNLQMFAPILFVYCVYTIIICLIIAVYNLAISLVTIICMELYVLILVF